MIFSGPTYAEPVEVRVVTVAKELPIYFRLLVLRPVMKMK